MSFPILTDQRFFKFSLNELFDIQSQVVKDYVGQVSSIREIADDIIREIQYPFHFGMPDDTHIFNCFHGNQKWCNRIDLDYWQNASETLTIKAGDCEDSSICFVTCARAFGLSFVEVHEAFGVVKDASTGQILGGHGWSYFKDEEGRHLYESTLDIPPSSYPLVEDIFKPVQLGNVIYEPEWVFNDSEFKEVSFSMSYDKRKKSDKETQAKYDAIAEAWKVDTKPSKKMRKSRIRKLRRLFKSER